MRRAWIAEGTAVHSPSGFSWSVMKEGMGEIPAALFKNR